MKGPGICASQCGWSTLSKLRRLETDNTVEKPISVYCRTALVRHPSTLQFASLYRSVKDHRWHLLFRSINRRLRSASEICGQREPGSSAIRSCITVPGMYDIRPLISKHEDQAITGCPWIMVIWGGELRELDWCDVSEHNTLGEEPILSVTKLSLSSLKVNLLWT